MWDNREENERIQKCKRFEMNLREYGEYEIIRKSTGNTKKSKRIDENSRETERI